MSNIIGTISVGGISVATGAPATAPGYDLLACGVGSRSRRRDTVTSPWVDDEFEVASVRGAMTYDLVVEIVGTSWANASDLKDALVAEVEQLEWTLVEDLDGHVETYSCDAALTIDTPINRDLMINFRRDVTVTIAIHTPT